MAMDDILLEVEEKMEGALEYLRKEFRGIRTGRASAGLVDHVKVDYYGSPTDLRQLATVSAPEATLIVIKPFDPSSVRDIEKAIFASDLGITPQVDRNMIRLSVPPLSMERRNRLVSQIRKMAEGARVAIRNARRDGNKDADKLQKDGEVGEDDAKKGKEHIQDLTKQYEAKVTELLELKTAEVQET